MKSIEILTNRLASLRDSYQHYTMVDKDKDKAFWIKNDIEEVEILLNELNELKRLKDIEEELGCPLKVVFKALNEGVYIEVEHLPDVIERPRLYCSDDFKCYCFELLYGEYVVKLSDYQKTWWLKGEKYNG